MVYIFSISQIGAWYRTLIYLKRFLSLDRNFQRLSTSTSLAAITFVMQHISCVLVQYSQTPI